MQPDSPGPPFDGPGSGVSGRAAVQAKEFLGEPRHLVAPQRVRVRRHGRRAQLWARAFRLGVPDSGRPILAQICCACLARPYLLGASVGGNSSAILCISVLIAAQSVTFPSSTMRHA